MTHGNTQSNVLNINTLDVIRQKLAELIKTCPSGTRMKITPDIARVMMERNESEEWRNRHLSEHTAARIARSIKEDRWMYTGEPIIFSKTGRMLNGQHRLTACMMADKPIDALIVFDVDDAAFKYMDIGTKRSAAHIFDIEQIPNYTFAASVARIVYYYLNDELWSGNATYGGYSVDNDVLLEFYSMHTKIQESCRPAENVRKAGLLPTRWAGALHYLCAFKNPYRANEFFYQLATGIGIENEKSAIYTLRRRLSGDSRARKSDKEPEHYRAAYVVQAWNAWSMGKTRKSYRWRSEQNEKDGRPEPFPRIV